MLPGPHLRLGLVYLIIQPTGIFVIMPVACWLKSLAWKLKYIEILAVHLK